MRTDHSHAFARLLRKEEPYVLSLPALVRACGEVMGRASWLLDTRSSEQFTHRAAALHLTEVLEASGETITTRVIGREREIHDCPAILVPGADVRHPTDAEALEDAEDAAAIDDAMAEEGANIPLAREGPALGVT